MATTIDANKFYIFSKSTNEVIDGPFETSRAASKARNDLPEELKADADYAMGSRFTVTEASSEEPPAVTKSKKAPKKVVKKDPPKADPAPKGDLVCLKEICEELDIDPKMARRRLRKSIYTPIEGTWCFNAATAKEVKTWLQMPKSTPKVQSEGPAKKGVKKAKKDKNDPTNVEEQGTSYAKKKAKQDHKPSKVKKVVA